MITAGLVAVSAAFIVPAWAARPEAGIIRNWATGRCLDSNRAGSVYTLGCNGGNYQKWRIQPVGRSTAGNLELLTYWVKNAETGLCLTADASSVYTSWCDANNQYQRWHFPSYEGWKRIELRQYLFLGSCLDSNHAGNVYKLGCNRGGFQMWRADGSM